MKRLSARYLAQIPVDELWDLITGRFILVFDDGELETNAYLTLYSAYAWEFHRQYPRTPMLRKHHVTEQLAGKRIGSDTHTDLLGEVAWSVYDTYANDPSTGMTEQQLRERLSEMIYRLTNVMYNKLSYASEADIVFLDITDFNEVLNHPKVKAANEALQPTQESIMETHSYIKGLLMDEREFPTNPIAVSMRAKLVNPNQILQCVSARGFMTDIESTQFKTPILRGFAQGLRLFHDSLIESRSASKSLEFSRKPLQDAEYFARRLQLVCQTVRNLHPTDCGSQHYLLVPVCGPSFVNGKLSSGGNLRQLKGVNYLDESVSPPVLRTLQGNEKHLIGTTIKTRSVTHCAHPDSYGVCSVCFGELSLSVPAGSNIGHMCCTSMTQKASQSVLSVKHLDGSAVVEAITLAPDEREYLKVTNEDNAYGLSDALLKAQRVVLIIPAARAPNISDVLAARSVMDLPPARISELEEIGIQVTDEHGVMQPIKSIYVHIGRRMASMTHALMEHIKQRGWDTVDGEGAKVPCYHIDMTGFDWSRSILELPLKHINMSDHSRDIAEMLESSVDEMQARDKLVSPDALLLQLHDLINDKLNVNLAVTSVIVYGAMIVSAEEGDYSLPKPWTQRGLGVMSMTMAYRSLSAAMAYEGHREMITSPISYIHTNRPDHPMDGILCPAEVFGHLGLPGSLPNAVTGWGILKPEWLNK